MAFRPLNPDRRFIEAQIRFHTIGADHYSQHRETEMARWSQERMAEWKAKLAALQETERRAPAPSE